MVLVAIGGGEEGFEIGRYGEMAGEIWGDMRTEMWGDGGDVGRYGEMAAMWGDLGTWWLTCRLVAIP